MTIKRDFLERFSYSQYLLLICILIVVPLAAGLIFDSYENTAGEYNNNFEILKNNTEQSIIETIKTADRGLVIYDASLDEEMKRGFKPFLEAYENSGGNPSEIDLEGIRESLGDNYNLYIIDENHEVIYSTAEIDIGLDFSYLKEFSAFLDSVREGDSYAGDRVVSGVRDTGSMRKYAYYPTPDHKYILELSYDIGNNSPRELLKYIKTVDELKNMNPYLTSVKMYDIFGYTVDEPEQPDAEMKEFIKEDVIRAKQDVIITDEINGTMTDFRFINFNEDGMGSDTSIVIEFTYSTEMLNEQIMSIWYYDTLKIAGLSLLLIIILGIFCICISRPVRNLVEDVDAIAAGDLDHKIRIGMTGNEFVLLERSISNMVERLKGTINRVRESEELIKKQNEELEEIVASRTKEALAKSDEANFYLDVITHDINNSNMAALGYAEIILDTSGDADEKESLKKLISAIHQNSEIIKNVSLMRTMKDEENPAVLFPVSLDSVIRHTMSLFPVEIEYGGTKLMVMADRLLDEVFTNILGNCIRHAGSGCKVDISVHDSGNMVIIDINDDGPGIPDGKKEECFNRYSRNLSGRKASGNGLGLYIVRTLVADRYGGTVEALDAVDGHPDKGLTIRISLRKAM